MWEGLAKKYGYRCWNCGKCELEVEESGGTLEKHHLREIINGGRNHISNIRLVCTQCHQNMGHAWYLKIDRKKKEVNK